MAIRRTDAERPDLSPETIAILLAGWCAKPPEAEAKWRGFAGNFLALYDAHDAGIIRLWNQHEAFLRATAARWRWQPSYEMPDGRRLFYAEVCALSQADQAVCAEARDHGGDDDDDV